LRAFVIGHLLVELDVLRRFAVELHVQPAALRRDGQIAIAEATHEIERLPRRLLQRESRCILGDVLLDRCTHLRRRAEESISRHQAGERLVRSLEVVRVDEERQAPLQISKVGKHGARQKLVPQRLPEALDLAERLRMLRPRLHVRDPFAPQLLFEFRRAAPRRVLTALVSEDLAWHSVRADSSTERLHHQL
jgi:hypothetical protein